MKKILVSILVLGLLSGPAAALSTFSSLPTSITVNPTFAMGLFTWTGGTGANRFDLVSITSIDFGPMNIGSWTGGKPSVIVDLDGTGGGTATAESGLIVKCATNYGNPWTIKVKVNQALLRDGGAETIANSNFKFWQWIVGPSQPTPEALGTIPTTEGRSISTADQLVYTAAASENVTADTRVHMQFGVAVPAVLAGTYRNNIVITMTE